MSDFGTNMSLLSGDDEYEDALSASINQERVVCEILCSVANQASLNTDLSQLPIIKLLRKQCKSSIDRLNQLEQYTRKNCLILLGDLGINPKLKGSRFSQQIVDFLNNLLFPLIVNTA